MIDFIGDIKHLLHMDGNTAATPAAVVLPPENPTIIVPIGDADPTAPTLIRQNWPSQHTIWTTWSHPGTNAWSNENLTDVKCPWALHMDKVSLHSIQINKKAAASLERVLNYIWVKAGKTQEAIEKLHYDRYSGSYNYRPIRGAHALSMHSYGLAIDFDDQENQQHDTHHLFQDTSLIVQAFKGEGWAWGGDWSRGSIDAMHFQAAHV
jgi:hypothetical protein